MPYRIEHRGGNTPYNGHLHGTEYPDKVALDTALYEGYYTPRNLDAIPEKDHQEHIQGLRDVFDQSYRIVPTGEHANVTPKVSDPHAARKWKESQEQKKNLPNRGQKGRRYIDAVTGRVITDRPLPLTDPDTVQHMGMSEMGPKEYMDDGAYWRSRDLATGPVSPESEREYNPGKVIIERYGEDADYDKKPPPEQIDPNKAQKWKESQEPNPQERKSCSLTKVKSGLLIGRKNLEIVNSKARERLHSREGYGGAKYSRDSRNVVEDMNNLIEEGVPHEDPRRITNRRIINSRTPKGPSIEMHEESERLRRDEFNRERDAQAKLDSHGREIKAFATGGLAQVGDSVHVHLPAFRENNQDYPETRFAGEVLEASDHGAGGKWYKVRSADDGKEWQVLSSSCKTPACKTNKKAFPDDSKQPKSGDKYSQPSPMKRPAPGVKKPVDGKTPPPMRRPGNPPPNRWKTLPNQGEKGRQYYDADVPHRERNNEEHLYNEEESRLDSEEMQQFLRERNQNPKEYVDERAHDLAQELGHYEGHGPDEIYVPGESRVRWTEGETLPKPPKESRPEVRGMPRPPQVKALPKVRTEK